MACVLAAEQPKHEAGDTQSRHKSTPRSDELHVVAASCKGCKAKDQAAEATEAEPRERHKDEANEPIEDWACSHGDIPLASLSCGLTSPCRLDGFVLADGVGNVVIVRHRGHDLRASRLEVRVRSERPPLAFSRTIDTTFPSARATR